MKYTRYNVKKKSNKSMIFFSIIIVMLVSAFLIGTIFTHFFIKNAVNTADTPVKKESSPQVEQQVSLSKDEKRVFIVVQGGLFENKQYAQECLNMLSAYGVPFTINEGERSRILLGIYPEAEGVKTMQLLTEKGIPNSKFTFQITKGTVSELEIGEMADAEVQILLKLQDKNVKAIQTGEFKKWTASLKEVDTKAPFYTEVKALKEHVAGLPSEITKEKVAECYRFLFDIIKKASSKN